MIEFMRGVRMPRNTARAQLPARTPAEQRWKLGVPVSDQRANPGAGVVEFYDQVSGELGDPVRGSAQDADAAGRARSRPGCTPTPGVNTHPFHSLNPLRCRALRIDRVGWRCLRQCLGRFHHRPVQDRRRHAARPDQDLAEVEFALMEWVDWYNNVRLHSRLGYLTPAEYESAYYAQTQPRRPALV